MGQLLQGQGGAFQPLDVFKHEQVDDAVSAPELGPAIAVRLARRGTQSPANVAASMWAMAASECRPSHSTAKPASRGDFPTPEGP